MSYFIDDRTIEEIKDRADIVSVISSYMDLTRAGANYKGLCPFHGEKTPSFTVSPNKGIYKCFGCGEGGNVINFVMKMDGLSFPDAVKKLADQFGVRIQENTKYNTGKKEKKEQIYQINREVAYTYMKNLGKSNKASSYLHRRGITPDVSNKFGIGYSEDSWDTVVNHLKSAKLDLDLAYEAGIIGKKGQNEYYDLYRNRIMFPIIDRQSKVIGFGARALDDSLPKYINTADSPIFLKRNNLYGINLQRKDKKVERLILVEGYMDVISLYANGVPSAVASLGTALTSEQVELLKKYTDNIFICYDGDSAGINATTRALSIIHSMNLNAKVIRLPIGVDPDDYIKNEGLIKFESRIKGAEDGFSYLINRHKEKLDLDTVEGKADLIRYVGCLIKKINSPIERELQIAKLAEEFDISVETLKIEIFNFKSDAKRVLPVEGKQDTKEKNYSISDKSIIEVLKIMLNNFELSKEISERIDLDKINNKQLIEVFKALRAALSDEKEPSKDFLLEYLFKNNIIDEDLYGKLDSDMDKLQDVSTKDLVEDLVNRINVKDRDFEKKELIKKINHMESIKDKTPEQQFELEKMVNELMHINSQSH